MPHFRKRRIRSQEERNFARKTFAICVSETNLWRPSWLLRSLSRWLPSWLLSWLPKYFVVPCTITCEIGDLVVISENQISHFDNHTVHKGAYNFDSNHFLIISQLVWDNCKTIQNREKRIEMATYKAKKSVPTLKDRSTLTHQQPDPTIPKSNISQMENGPEIDVIDENDTSKDKDVIAPVSCSLLTNGKWQEGAGALAETSKSSADNGTMRPNECAKHIWDNRNKILNRERIERAIFISKLFMNKDVDVLIMSMCEKYLFTGRVLEIRNGCCLVYIYMVIGFIFYLLPHFCIFGFYHVSLCMLTFYFDISHFCLG